MWFMISLVFSATSNSPRNSGLSLPDAISFSSPWSVLLETAQRSPELKTIRQLRQRATALRSIADRTPRRETGNRQSKEPELRRQRRRQRLWPYATVPDGFQFGRVSIPTGRFR